MARAIDWTQVGALKTQGHGDRAIARELGIPSTTFHRERQKRQGRPSQPALVAAWVMATG